MANVVIKPAVKKVVEEIIEPSKVVVELSKEEAALLFAVVGKMSGRVISSFYNKLDALGFCHKNSCSGINLIDVASFENRICNYVETPKELD